jgi:hypothetical protein
MEKSKLTNLVNNNTHEILRMSNYKRVKCIILQEDQEEVCMKKSLSLTLALVLIVLLASGCTTEPPKATVPYLPTVTPTLTPDIPSATPEPPPNMSPDISPDIPAVTPESPPLSPEVNPEVSPDIPLSPAPQ